MPPWHVDKTVGIQEFKDDRSLSDEQIDIVVRWVDSGSPMGNASDLPPAIEWPDYGASWRLAELYGRPPDLVIKGTPYTVVPNGQDQWFAPDVEVTGLTEPRWIMAAEGRPGTPKTRYVFHHGNTRFSNGDEGALLATAVGKEYDIYPKDTGKLISPGSVVNFDMHFFPIGEEVDGAFLEVGLWFYPRGERPKYETVGETTFLAGSAVGPRNMDLLLPPNGTQMMQGVHLLKQPARIHSVRGHMHLRGKAQSLEAIYPDGRREVLTRLNWDHAWAVGYHYAEHVQPLLPAGTILITTSWFDNTSANRSNPDPNVWVGFGRRSVDEMSHLWIGITYLSDEQFKVLTDERVNLLRQMSQQAHQD